MLEIKYGRFFIDYKSKIKAYNNDRFILSGHLASTTLDIVKRNCTNTNYKRNNCDRKNKMLKEEDRIEHNFKVYYF